MAEVIQKGFTPASNADLPCVDLVMLGKYISSNNKSFSPAIYKNETNSAASYGDEAITYVQFKRNDMLCTVKCVVCPEKAGQAKFAVTMVVDEQNESVTSVQCHKCTCSNGTCIHALALLMWVHRKSEQPVNITRTFHWGAPVGTTLKQGRKRKPVDDNALESATMPQLILKYKPNCEKDFLKKVSLNDSLIKEIEQETRDNKNHLWRDLRVGRITASLAYDVSSCEIYDSPKNLVLSIMGQNVEDTFAMKRGREMKDAVREVVCRELGKQFEKCGLYISKQYPIIAGSPDGISEDGIISIKCPMSEKTIRNYVKYGKPSDKYYTQMQILMYLTEKTKCYFCVAHWNFEHCETVKIESVDYNKTHVKEVLENMIEFWKMNVYNLLT